MKATKVQVRTLLQAIGQKRIPMQAHERVTAMSGPGRQAAGQVMGFDRHYLGPWGNISRLCPLGQYRRIHNETLLEAPPYPARRPRIRTVSWRYGDIGTRHLVNSLRPRLDEGGGSTCKILDKTVRLLAESTHATAQFSTIPMVWPLIPMTEPNNVTLTDARGAADANFNPFGRHL